MVMMLDAFSVQGIFADCKEHGIAAEDNQKASGLDPHLEGRETWNHLDHPLNKLLGFIEQSQATFIQSRGQGYKPAIRW